MDFTVVERLVEWAVVEAGGEAGRMDSSAVAKIGMVDLTAFGTVLNQHISII